MRVPEFVVCARIWFWVCPNLNKIRARLFGHTAGTTIQAHQIGARIVVTHRGDCGAHCFDHSLRHLRITKTYKFGIHKNENKWTAGGYSATLGPALAAALLH